MTPSQLAFLPALMLALPALAETDSLSVYDLNGDGALSRGEFRQLQLQVFGLTDLDQNGLISPDEATRAATAQGHKMNARRLAQRDANGDGMISLAEFTAATPLFDRADRNHDGQLAASEIDRIRALLPGRAQ